MRTAGTATSPHARPHPTCALTGSRRSRTSAVATITGRNGVSTIPNTSQGTPVAPNGILRTASPKTVGTATVTVVTNARALRGTTSARASREEVCAALIAAHQVSRKMPAMATALGALKNLSRKSNSKKCSAIFAHSGLAVRGRIGEGRDGLSGESTVFFHTLLGVHYM